MRNHTLTAILIILLVLPSLGNAATLESVAGTADCNGWSADLGVTFRTGAFFVRMEYSVILQDASGVEVERFDYSEFVQIPGTESATYSYGETWSSTLDGDYTVVGEFVLHDLFDGGENLSTGSFTSNLACGESGGGDDDPVVGEPCLYPARYWHRYPELWPVTSLQIGDRTLTQDEMMIVMDHRSHRLVLLVLTRELITAKLNLANGGNTDILDIVAEAEALMMNYPENSRNRGQTRREAVRLTQALQRYNRSGCPDDEVSGVTISLGGEANLTGDESEGKAAVELMTLGTIKAMYR